MQTKTFLTTSTLAHELCHSIRDNPSEAACTSSAPMSIQGLSISKLDTGHRSNRKTCAKSDLSPHGYGKLPVLVCRPLYESVVWLPSNHISRTIKFVLLTYLLPSTHHPPVVSHTPTHHFANYLFSPTPRSTHPPSTYIQH